MLELSMHILDLVQNSLAAQATRVEIRIREDLKQDLLSVEVRDNGRGMPGEMIRKVTDPFFTSRTTREIGLGLPLLKEAAERCGGRLEVESREGEGTKVLAMFQLDHLDRAPLGDMGETLALLITGNPEADFFYHHEVDGESYRLDTREMREILGPVHLDDPSLFGFVRQDVQKGLKAIGAASFPKNTEELR